MMRRITSKAQAVCAGNGLAARLPHVAAAVMGVLLVGAMSLQPALAYFTDSSYATGGIPIKVKPDTTITEEYGDRTKHIVIKNDEVSVPVFVRARIFTNAEHLSTVAGDGWGGLQADGWYYYAYVVDPGQETSELLATIIFPVPAADDPDADAASQAGENFNVVVVYEATPAQYDGDLLVDPQAADWDLFAQEGE